MLLGSGVVFTFSLAGHKTGLQMWGQNRGSVEDAYPRRYSPSPLQNLRQGIKQSLLFALLAIRLHYLYTHTQRLSTVAMCKASASLGSESGESAIMTVVSLICARVSVEISDFAPRADKVRRARRFASPRAAKLGIGPPSRLRWTRQRIAAAVVPERRSLIRDRNGSKRLFFCDPGSRFAWPG